MESQLPDILCGSTLCRISPTLAKKYEERGKIYLRPEVKYANNCPTRCNNIRFIYVCKPLYMFRVVSPPIIRSSCHCIHSWSVPVQSRSRQVHVAVTVLPIRDAVDTVTWAPDDGWRYHPKHVERFTDINKLYTVASCWTIIGIYFTTHGPLNVKYVGHWAEFREPRAKVTWQLSVKKSYTEFLESASV